MPASSDSPESHLEASADLGAKGAGTRSGGLAAGRPAVDRSRDRVHVLAELSATTSPSQIVGGTLQVLGTTVLQNITLDLPFAAALGTTSVAIMVCYLVAVGRTGALDNL